MLPFVYCTQWHIWKISLLIVIVLIDTFFNLKHRGEYRGEFNSLFSLFNLEQYDCKVQVQLNPYTIYAICYEPLVGDYPVAESQCLSECYWEEWSSINA